MIEIKGGAARRPQTEPEALEKEVEKDAIKRVDHQHNNMDHLRSREHMAGSPKDKLRTRSKTR